MSNEGEPLQNFNLDTMSGIYPGTRTQVYQRLRVRPQERIAAGPVSWYTLHWYVSPASIALHATSQGQVAAEPVLAAQPPDRPQELFSVLQSELSARGLRADACFACRYWSPGEGTNDDGVPTGRCTWGETAARTGDPAERLLRVQSGLSLSCSHFAERDAAAQQPVDRDQDEVPVRLQKSAELDPDRLSFWPRLWHKLRRRNQPRQPDDWATRLVERSGVGAGTEPCFVCQGRLANLGALAVATEEDDKQTFSVWRCRQCYTTYLNDWTDRWERLESLETEERYFRLAPAEAHAVLHIIHTTPGGEHPGQRGERGHHRAQILALLENKRALSHQIRQGR